jgi:hypothetical protein
MRRQKDLRPLDLASGVLAAADQAAQLPPLHLAQLGAVASCVGNAADASGLVKVVVSSGEVNRRLFGECFTEALPAIDFAHGDLA